MKIMPIQINSSNPQPNFNGTIDKSFYHYINTAKGKTIDFYVFDGFQKLKADSGTVELEFAKIEKQLKEFMSKIANTISLTFKVYRGQGDVFYAPAFVNKINGHTLFAGTKTWPILKKGKIDTKNGCINLPKTCQYWHRPQENDMNFRDLHNWTRNLIDSVNPEDINNTLH